MVGYAANCAAPGGDNWDEGRQASGL